MTVSKETVSKATEPMRDEVLDFVHKSEEAFNDATRRWTDAMHDLVSSDGDRIRKVVDEAFDFAERMIRNQRELAGNLLDSLLGEAPKPAPAAKKAVKPATRKAPAKPKAKKAAA